MPSYFPPKKNTAYTCYISLISQANTKVMQSSPTLETGDFKVSIDGGTLTNLTTLPSVSPASSKMVVVSLSSSEMNGDNITIVCSDAAGAEWCDLVLNLQTTARQLDDLAYPATSGRSLAVDTSGQVTAGTLANNAITAAAIAADAITAAKIADGAIDAATFAAGAVAEIQSGLMLAASYSAPDNSTISAIAGYIDTEVAAIKAKTDNLPASPAATSDIPSAAANAAALLDSADGVETGLTPRGALRLIAAALAGVLSGAGTSTVVVKNAVANTKTRITATTDEVGNRSVVNTDVS